VSNKAQKKHQKKVARRKKIDKERNQRANKSMRRYSLDVKYEGEWKRGVKTFKTAKEVNKHLDDTNEIRKRGDTEIIEGYVIDLNTMQRVAHIKPYMPLEMAQSMFDVAKDLSLKEDNIEINKEIFDKSVGK
jgi:single-stranded DNA-specific DHH superfamily exonuclease